MNKSDLGIYKFTQTKLIDNIRYELEGDLDSAIKTLQEYRDKYKDEYDQLSIDIDMEQDYYSSYIAISLSGYRKESKEEYEKRIKAEQTEKELTEAREIALAKELIKKYNIRGDDLV